MRLLLVEDDRRLSALVSDSLNSRGFSCDQAYDLESADDFLKAAHYDLIVLDLGLPDGDGRDWLRGHRTAGNWPPTLVLSARTGLEDRVQGLNSGADDYLAKPFAIEELVARLHALTRRPGARLQPVLKVGQLTFETHSRMATCEGVPLELSRREADLLELLMRSPGALVSRRTIDEALYGVDDAVTPNAVEAVVSRLRRKLESAGCHSTVNTVRGIGYILKAGRDA